MLANVSAGGIHPERVSSLRGSRTRPGTVFDREVDNAKFQLTVPLTEQRDALKLVKQKLDIIEHMTLVSGKTG